MYTPRQIFNYALFRIKRYVVFLAVLGDWSRFRKLDEEKRFAMSLKDVYPFISESTPLTSFDPHYIYHPAWAARKVKEIDAAEHVDISSTLHFSTIVSAFKPVKFYDLRPATIKLPGLSIDSVDLVKLPFKDNSIPSLSCMHTVEHVGLGRYGDTVDPEGDVKATKELGRVVSKGGSLLFVVPVGRARIEFNAHRIYSYDMVMALFPGFTLKEFSLIPDGATKKGMTINATKEECDKQKYGCGCFWLIKK